MPVFQPVFEFLKSWIAVREKGFPGSGDLVSIHQRFSDYRSVNDVNFDSDGEKTGCYYRVSLSSSLRSSSPRLPWSGEKAFWCRSIAPEVLKGVKVIELLIMLMGEVFLDIAM